MTGKFTLLVANGVLAEDRLRKIEPGAVQSVVATDGAAQQLFRLGIRPEVIIGDLDSISPEELETFSGSQIIRRPSQSLNDLEKALQYCREHNFRRLNIFGITGGREDHTLTNFSVLARYLEDFEMEIVTPFATIFPVRDQFSYTGNPGQLISLLPFGESVGVTTQGLKYPLQRARLALGLQEGLSNQIIDRTFEVTLQDGLLLVFINHSAL